MTPSEYQKLAARTLLPEPGFDIPGDQMMLAWCAIGLAGEAGEVAEVIKKGVFHRHGVDDEKLGKEIGDCLWYLAGLCTITGFDLEVLMEMNIAKLRLRYPDGFTSEDSQKRVDVKGEI